MILAKLFYSQTYQYYRNHEWPLCSSLSSSPTLLNIAFPDHNIVYYLASFHSSDTITLKGIIPPNIYFWSLTLYDIDGSIVNFIDDAKIKNSYTIQIHSSFQNDWPQDNVYKMKAPLGYYCAILRFGKCYTTPNIYPDYLPKISGVLVKIVTFMQQVENSLKLEKLLSPILKNRLKFSETNMYQFFIPSIERINKIFCNPFSKYMIVALKNQCLKVSGVLQKNINVRFVSYMTANCSTTATDNSIEFSNFILNQENEYTLYAAFDLQTAMEHGYDSSFHNLILWKPTNTIPILVYRVVLSDPDIFIVPELIVKQF